MQRMKRILKWLEAKFSRHSDDVEADERNTPVEKDVDHDTIIQPVLRIREESSYIVIESPAGIDPYNSGRFESSESLSRK